MISRRASQQVFFGTSALLFAASAALTTAWWGSMSAMGEMTMPGGWTMSMAWMRMPGETWPGAAASFLGMWIVMMVAMMLPSLVPMLWRYRRAVGRAGKTRLGRLTGLVGDQWRICFDWATERRDLQTWRLLTITRSMTMALPPIHPGEHLAEELQALNMSAAELARKIDVPTNRVTQILNGARSITGDTALRLAHFFGTSAQFWLNLQSLYDLRLAQEKSGKSIKALPTLKRRKLVHALS